MSQSPLKVGYGLSEALPSIFPNPIIARRSPTASDIKYQLGQVWLYPASNFAYMLTSVAAGAANWIQIIAGGAGGFFSTLTSTGQTMLATTGASINTFGNVTGTTSITISSGTGGTSLVTAATGTITLGNAGMTGTITIGNSTAGQAINIGAAAGTDTITIGNNHLATTINLIAGTAGISITSPNVISSGYFSGTTFYATGDAGGAASTVAITDVSVPNTGGTGAFFVVSATGAGTANSAGFIKMYIGVTAVYIPYFTATS